MWVPVSAGGGTRTTASTIIGNLMKSRVQPSCCWSEHVNTPDPRLCRAVLCLHTATAASQPQETETRPQRKRLRTGVRVRVRAAVPPPISLAAAVALERLRGRSCARPISLAVVPAVDSCACGHSCACAHLAGGHLPRDHGEREHVVREAGGAGAAQHLRGYVLVGALRQYKRVLEYLSRRAGFGYPPEH